MALDDRLRVAHGGQVKPGVPAAAEGEGCGGQLRELRRAERGAQKGREQASHVGRVHG